MRRAGLLLYALLVGCSRGDDASAAPDQPQPDLETAAIAAGVIHDPSDADLTGSYARDTDQVCILPAASDYTIGIAIDYDEGQGCSAAGTVTRDGETLRIALHAPGRAATACTIDARFEGDAIVFPGRVPAACARLCRGRASLAALDAERLSDSAAEAVAMRDRRGRLLCGG